MVAVNVEENKGSGVLSLGSNVNSGKGPWLSTRGWM